MSRETREGWPLQSVETEVKRDAKRTNERGPILVGTRDFCSSLAALVGPVQNIFYSLYTVSIPLSTSQSKLAGSRAG